MLWAARLALPATFLFFLPRLLEQFEAPKAAALRVLGCAALGAAAASTRALRSTRWGWVDAAVLAWVAVEILATTLSVAPRISLLGDPEQREGLLTSIGLAGLYLAARVGSRSPSDVRGMLDLALVSAALASLYAVVQALGLDPVPWARTSSFAGLTMRPFGTFGHPNLLGLVSGAAASAALAMALLDPGRRLRYGLVMALGTVATLLTLSRGAWIGTAAGMLAAVGLAWGAGTVATIPRRTRWIAAAAILVALAAVPLIVGPRWREFFFGRLAGSFAEGLGAGRARFEIWRTALAAWLARPGFGHGPDTFSLIFPRYQTAAYWRHEWSGLPLHSHSIYLHTLATRGAMGVAAIACCLAALVRAARSAWRAGTEYRPLVTALAAALCSICVSGLFGSIGIGGMAWTAVIAAGFATLAGIGEEDGASSLSGSRSRGAGARRSGPPVRGGSASVGPLLAGALTGLFALGWATADIAASVKDRRGLTLMELSTRESGPRVLLARRAAAKACEKASVWMPFEDAIFRRRADSLRFLAAAESDAMPILAEAERQARRAVAMAPLRSLNHRYLGLILLSQVKLGDARRISEGEAAYARSLELAPNDGLVMIELARAEIELGRPRLALEPAGRAAALYPEQAEPLAVLATAHLALGETEPARAALERSLGADWRGDEASRREAERTLKSLSPARP
jgi:O-antigen ligase